MKRKLHRITVSGHGHFPLDMLRYDACWPAREHDAFELVTQISRSVMLHAWNPPTVGRWESFGWKVDLVETIATV